MVAYFSVPNKLNLCTNRRIELYHHQLAVFNRFLEFPFSLSAIVNLNGRAVSRWHCNWLNWQQSAVTMEVAGIVVVAASSDGNDHYSFEYQ